MIDTTTPRLTRLSTGFLVEGFGERGFFPDCRALHYLAWLLDHPGLPISATELVVIGNEQQIPRILESGTTGDSCVDLMTLKQVCERLSHLRDELIPSLQERTLQSIADGQDQAAEDSRLTLLNKTIEAGKLADYLGSSLGIGKLPRACGSSFRERARTTTRANLMRFFKQLRANGMKSMAGHLERYVHYGNGCWWYEHQNMDGLVEHL